MNEQLLSDLNRYTGPWGIRAKHLRGQVLVDLVDIGLLTCILDLYMLTPEDIDLVTNFNYERCVGVIETLKARSKVNFAQFICSMNIPGVGITKARHLALRYKDLDGLAEAEVLEFIDYLSDSYYAAEFQDRFTTRKEELVILLRDHVEITGLV